MGKPWISRGITSQQRSGGHAAAMRARRSSFRARRCAARRQRSCVRRGDGPRPSQVLREQEGVRAGYAELQSKPRATYGKRRLDEEAREYCKKNGVSRDNRKTRLSPTCAHTQGVSGAAGPRVFVLSKKSSRSQPRLAVAHALARLAHGARMHSSASSGAQTYTSLSLPLASSRSTR